MITVFSEDHKNTASLSLSRSLMINLIMAVLPHYIRPLEPPVTWLA